MSYLLFCHLAPDADERRHRLRAEHLAYIGAHRTLILAGGPTLHDDGSPDTMIIGLDVDALDAATAFIEREPYNANGVFDHVQIRRWARVLPEPVPGALDRAIADEQRASSLTQPRQEHA